MIKTLSQENIFILSSIFKNRNELLKYIAKKAQTLNITKDYKNVYKAFLKREKESTTGMENFIAIPHAFSDKIMEHKILIFCLENPVIWETLDQVNQVKFIIALLIPKNQYNNNHLKSLSLVAQKLLDQKTVDALNSYNTLKIYEVFQ